VSEASEGNFTAEPYVGTLDNGGIGIAPFHDFDSTVPAELKSKIEELKQQIIDGTLTVESPSSN
jgi:basic membrane protein A